ncbi:hypothetical protein F5882DRAFT_387462 [Hyaloscypha sp. PMI_1271]|nr:hypothetical protein F5882DRAFT_387462 [Hyaloscypha sp. PMI_1271]
MALKQIIGLSSLAALAGTSFASPVAPGVRQYVPTGGSSSWTTVTTTWSNSRTTDSTVFSSTASSCSESSSTPSTCVSNTTTSSSGPVGLSTPNTASLSTVSSSLTSTRPCGSASLIVQTLTEPGECFVTLTLPTSASVTGLETLTISSSILTVEPVTAAPSGSVSLIVVPLLVGELTSYPGAARSTPDFSRIRR